MSAHHPKASMIGATSVSTPMVGNPNERRVNIAAAGLAQIEAIMATGKGFEEAYAEAWRREVKPRQASVLMLEAPAATTRPRLDISPRATVKTLRDREAEDAQMQADIISHVKRTGIETSASQLIKGYKAAPNLVYAALSHLVRAGVLVKREANTRTFYGLAGVPMNQYVHNNGTGNAKKARTIDGVKYESLKEACQKLKVSKGVILRWSENGVSDDCTRTSPRTCNIDGVEYASIGEASRALGKAKSVIALWAKTGVSKPSKRLSPHCAEKAATASQATRTRKNSQTPSSGAISQSGAQMGGL